MMKRRKIEKYHFTKEELQHILDGIEDTKSKIINGTAYPTNEAYNQRNFALKKKVERYLKEE